jgi:hypothetical protein
MMCHKAEFDCLPVNQQRMHSKVEWACAYIWKEYVDEAFLRTLKIRLGWWKNILLTTGSETNDEMRTKIDRLSGSQKNMVIDTAGIRLTISRYPCPGKPSCLFRRRHVSGKDRYQSVRIEDKGVKKIAALAKGIVTGLAVTRNP